MWRTGKLGVLQSMWSQGVGHNWVTELINHTNQDPPCLPPSFPLFLPSFPPFLPSFSPLIPSSFLSFLSLQQIFIDLLQYFKSLSRTLERCPWIKQIKKLLPRTSLVIQWLRICLAMQGIPVQALVRELRSHILHPVEQLSLYSTTRESMCHNERSHGMQLRPVNKHWNKHATK